MKAFFALNFLAHVKEKSETEVARMLECAVAERSYSLIYEESNMIVMMTLSARKVNVFEQIVQVRSFENFERF